LLGQLSLDISQIIEVVTQPETDSHLPHGFVAFKHKPGEQRRRAVFDRQRVGQTQIVLGNNVREIERHVRSLSGIAGGSEPVGDG